MSKKRLLLSIGTLTILASLLIFLNTFSFNPPLPSTDLPDSSIPQPIDPSSSVISSPTPLSQPIITALPPTPLPSISVSSQLNPPLETNLINNTPQIISTTEPAALPIPQQPVPNQVVITFQPNTTPQERQAYIQQIGGTVSTDMTKLNSVVVSLPTNVTGQPLPQSSIIAASEPDYYVVALGGEVNDPLYDQQWALSAIAAPDGWSALPASAATVAVAVIDSGICADHPDLHGRILPGYDFVDNDPLPQDDYGHGCAVAGIIAANSNNGVGIAGIAPNAHILPVRVLNAQGIGTYSDVAAGIVYAADQGAKIINLSLGGANASTVLEDAVNYAINKSVTVIAAAGNTGGAVLYPAAYAPVIAVASVDQNLQRSSFSSYGPEIDLLAPGRDILTTSKDGSYKLMSGTSFAAPQVAGVAAVDFGLGTTLVLNGGIANLNSNTAVFVPTDLPPQPISPEYQTLLTKVRQQGSLRVIIGLKTIFQPEGNLPNTQAVQAQQGSIQQLQSSLLSSLSSYHATVLGTYRHIPFIALVVDEQALIHLMQLTYVSSITEDKAMRLSLNTSRVVVGAENAWAVGATGSGQTVAILDSGVDRNHQFLANKVVDEACYSHPNTAFGTGESSLCPNGQSTQVGNGAAIPTLCSEIEGDACSHGTHVAGIAAGISGIAKDAKIIAIQVFHKAYNILECFPSSRCIKSYESDQLLGLEHVYELRNSPNLGNITAVNLSLGGGLFSGVCDTTVNYGTAYKAIVDTLRSVGIATIVASGNDHSSNMISFPACISSVIRVGATTDFDQVADFSNSSTLVDLLAPGVDILSSVPGPNNDEVRFMSGTSQATPHVTGAWAILKGYFPNATIDEILNLLQTNGVTVIDPRNNRSFKRIQIDQAVGAIKLTCNPDAFMTMFSVASDGTIASLGAGGSSMSADGRYIAFSSHSPNLVPNDTNDKPDVFVYDRQTCRTELVSVSSIGTQSDGDSGSASISADGRYVAFTSWATTLVGNDTNRVTDAFVHDIHTGTTTRVSVTSGGGQVGGCDMWNNCWWSSGAGPISGNGRYIGFGSNATELVGENHTGGEFFVYDMQTGQTEMVSSVSDADSNWEFDFISADGRYLLFEGTSIDFDSTSIPNCGNITCPQVYVRDRLTNQIRIGSVSSSGDLETDTPVSASLSEDGRYLVFSSRASNLVVDDTNGAEDVFLHDFQTGQTTRISVASDGSQLSEYSTLWGGTNSISADGHYIVFESASNQVVPGDTNVIGYFDEAVRDVFLYDLLTGLTKRLSMNQDGSQSSSASMSPTISSNGRYVTFGSVSNPTGVNLPAYATQLYVIDLDQLPPALTGLQQPSSLSTVTTLKPTFTWTAMPDAVSYEIQIDTAIPLTTLATSTIEAQYTTSNPLTDGWYFWRIRTQVADGRYSAWSDIWQFKVDHSALTVGTISGTVYDSGGVTPLTGIHVRLHSLDYSYAIEACTNEQGGYSFDSIPFDLNIIISAFGSGMCGAIDYGGEFWQEAPDEASATLIQVTAANPTLTNINFTLDPAPPTGTISGTVYDTTGTTPLANLTVAFNTGTYGYGVYTDADGNYQLTGVPLDTDVYVSAYMLPSDSGGSSGNYAGEYWQNTGSQQSATPLHLTGTNSDATGIDFTLDPAGYITGSVRDAATNQPIENISVWFENSLTVTCTSADGSYALNGVPFDTPVKVASGPSGWCLENGYPTQWYPNTNYGNATPITVTSTNSTVAGIDFLMSDVVLLPPQLLGPTDFSSTTNTRPQFTWSPAVGADHYEFLINSNISSGSGTIYIVFGTSYQPSTPLLTTTYFWWVRSVDASQNYSDWTQTRTLTVSSPANAAPQRNLVTTHTPTLTWGRLSWAIGYGIEVDTDPNFGSPDYKNDLLDANALTATTGVLPNGTYYWRVHAKKTDGTWGGWSTVDSFVLEAG